MLKIGVLASGKGSNLQAIIDSINKGEVAGEVVLVISDRSNAGALLRAENHGIRNLFLDPRKFKDRKSYDERIIGELKKENVELILLAGYMRLLSPVMIQSFHQRIMNIHPSLLPSFPGKEGVSQAFDYGVKVTGCTVHFVDEGLDTGPVILQDSVPVLQEDTLETLQSRIHAAEHRIYPRAVDLFSRGIIKVKGRRCIIDEKKE